MCLAQRSLTHWRDLKDELAAKGPIVNPNIKAGDDSSDEEEDDTPKVKPYAYLKAAPFLLTQKECCQLQVR